MVLYTVYPHEMVLEGQESYSPEYIEFADEECRIVVELISPNSGKIVRLISADSGNYLDPALQPGVLLTFDYIKSHH